VRQPEQRGHSSAGGLPKSRDDVQDFHVEVRGSAASSRSARSAHV
jgi:hypothetical protein